jgi:hypothetical protein
MEPMLLLSSRLLPLTLLGLLAACSGSTTPSPTPTPTPGGSQSQTFTGTASISSTGGCSGPGHAITTGTGNLSVTLVQSSAAQVAVQVCHPTAVNHATECTVPPFARIAVGSSVSATLKGGTAQVITVFPEACGQPGTPPAATVTNTIRADFPG